MFSKTVSPIGIGLHPLCLTDSSLVSGNWFPPLLSFSYFYGQAYLDNMTLPLVTTDWFRDTSSSWTNRLLPKGMCNSESTEYGYPFEAWRWKLETSCWYPLDLQSNEDWSGRTWFQEKRKKKKKTMPRGKKGGVRQREQSYLLPGHFCGPAYLTSMRHPSILTINCLSLTVS